jgi:O-antigen/teichoic acid export membrane protein
MSVKSIKTNVFYNMLLRFTNLIFPLITFPYVARILSPEGVGKVNFSFAIIQFFVLIAQVGIPTYGIRECAKVRTDKNKLTKTVQEILSINLIALIVSYILFMLIILNVKQLDTYRNLLLIASINIFSTSIGIQWFYKGLEEYKYITIKGFFIKLLALIAVFVFVKNINDFKIYALIIALSTSLGYLINFIYLKKYIYFFKRYEHYEFRKHLKPILTLFIMSISMSVYLVLDKVMLGFLSGDNAIGLYTAANNMIIIVISLVTSISAVMLPRISYYLKHDQKEKVNVLITKSLDFIFMVSIPATIGIIMLAKPIILIFAGSAYLDGILTLQILSPVIIAMGLSNLIGIQVLISFGLEKITLISAIVGAVINFVVNLFLIPLFAQNGAAIGTLTAEI